MTIKEFLKSEDADFKYLSSDILEDIVKDIAIHRVRTAGKKSPAVLVWTDINWKYRYMEKEKELILL